MEYCKNVREYYEWIPKEGGEFNNLRVLSLNASGIECNMDEFCQYCIDTLYKILKKPEEYVFYFIVYVKIRNKNSKMERYKKCWKSIADKVNIKNLKLGEERAYIRNNDIFYVGIAKGEVKNLHNIIEIAHEKNKKCILFASKNNYDNFFDTEDDFIEKNMTFDRYGDIEYDKCISYFCSKREICVRYGTSFSEAELALIFRSEEFENIFNVSEKCIIENMENE